MSPFVVVGIFIVVVDEDIVLFVELGFDVETVVYGVCFVVPEQYSSSW